MASRLAKPVLIVSGLVTCTMAYAAIDPAGALASTFNSSLDGPAAEVVVRNWGVLITLIGLMLIYAAFKPQVRGLVLTVATVSKLTFAGLILSQADAFAGGSALMAVGVDAVFILLFLWLLATLGPKREAPPLDTR